MGAVWPVKFGYSGTHSGALRWALYPKALMHWRKWDAMQMVVRAWVWLAVCCFPLFAAAGEGAAGLSFNRDIRPILAAHCFACHGPDTARREGGLRLDTLEGATAELPSGGRAVEPGRPEASLLWQRIAARDPHERMPPPGEPPLSQEEVQRLRRWLEEGAPWEPHWSLSPLRRPAVPNLAEDWAAGPIDRFLAEKWRHAGIEPAPQAERVTLIRRLSYDLTGLPPDPAEVDAFEIDSHPDAWERLVDRLLASPHYGERMAAWWLDLVRYADSVGYHGDQERSVSPYRDYVIAAFNGDLPFDQFTIEQLAGDLLPQPTLWQQVAAGYNMLGMTTIEGGAQAKEYLAKYASDRVRNVSAVWLGATLGCAECHDHKYDPYTMSDFYSMAAFFADIQQEGVGNPEATLLVPDARQAAELAELAAREAALRAQAEEAQSDGASGQNESPTARADGNGAAADVGSADPRASAGQATDSAVGGRLSSAVEAELAAIAARREALLREIRRTIPTVSGEPRVVRILPRGNWLDETGPVVQPAVPACLPQPADAATRRLSRLDLARWLVRPDHPQVARTYVNRLWKLFFGAGMTPVLDDLGVQGGWPSHPELLDWLAVEFIESGFSTRHVVRQIVLSRAYRQSWRASRETLRADPANRLFSRQRRFRMDAEWIRDTALAASGLLVREIGGASVKPYQPAGYWDHLNFPPRTYTADDGPAQYRRGAYIHWQRTFLHPMLLAFDAPTREECTAQRMISNTPQAALVLLNDPTFVEAARKLAERLLREAPPGIEPRIAWAWRQVLSRRPTGDETAVLAELYAAHHAHYEAHPDQARLLVAVGQAPPADELPLAELAAWTSVARTLLNLDETVTRE
jgi:mono/diheme cytochrome c family protein